MEDILGKKRITSERKERIFLAGMATYGITRVALVTWLSIAACLNGAISHAQGRNEQSLVAAIKTTDAKTITLAAVGDIMMGTSFTNTGVFGHVQNVLKSPDITVGNLEGVLIDGGKSSKCDGSHTGHCYTFGMPTRYVVQLKEAGFDFLSMANNHAFDYGEAGIRSTEKTLQSFGIEYSGLPGSFSSVDIKGAKVAFIAFATSPKTNNMNNLEQARDLVRKAAQTHRIVIVTFHGGAEGEKAQHVPRGHETYLGEDRGDVVAFSHAMIDAGADVVLGHGPHVVRGLEAYKDKIIAYSLGNFATSKGISVQGEKGLAFIFEVTLDAEGTFMMGKIIPTEQQSEQGIPRVDTRSRSISRIQELSRQDFSSTMPNITSEGGVIPKKRF